MANGTGEWTGGPNPASQARPTRVALFLPCLTDAFDTRVAECSGRLLEAAGHGPIELPAGQTCCGQALRNGGLLKDAERLVARMAKVFTAADAVVTPSASCAAFVQRHGPPELAAKTHELASFLVAQGFDPRERDCRWPGRVAYHLSCHGRELRRPVQTEDAALDLLSKVGDLEVVPLPRASQCCGFGGTFATSFASVSVALGRDKLAAASEADVTTLVANDGGCRLHLGSLDQRAATPPITLKHVAEILAEGCHLVPRPPRMLRPAP